MSDWRMKEPCVGCPFANSPGGIRQRKALRPARWRAIKRAVLAGAWFACHKTTGATDDDGDDDSMMPPAGSLYCAGALAFEDTHGVSSNYRRVCENLDYFREQRERNRTVSRAPK